MNVFNYLVTGVLVAAQVSARADSTVLPPVDGFNLRLQASGSTSDFVDTESGAVSAFFPIYQQFGAAVSGHLRRNFYDYSEFSGVDDFNTMNASIGVSADLFWRDPAKGLLGFTLEHEREIRESSFVGIAAEYYLERFTISGQGGRVIREFRDDASIAVVSVKFYATENLMLSVARGEYDLGGNQSGLDGDRVTAAVEWQPHFESLRMSVFMTADHFEDAEVYDYRVGGGIKIHFGSDKSLIRRNREDDVTLPKLID